MQLIAILLIGFSLFTAIVLVIGNLFQQIESQTIASKLCGLSLIFCLSALQWLNLQAILGHSNTLFSPLYIFLLYVVAPCFYCYSYNLLGAQHQLKWWHLFHALPPFISLAIPFPWPVPLAFLLGSGYLIWLAKCIYYLRGQRARFKLELLALAVFFSIAIVVIILGFIWPLISNSTFVTCYSIMIGLAFFSTLLTLLHFPSITLDITEAARAAYAESTLKNIDRNKVLEQLTHLMQEEQIFTLENLSLTIVSEQLQLSSHQLSELINSEFNLGFSKFIRQYRIKNAKKLLLSQPKASILSIGLSVGFNTQSNFYSAFRDIEGMAPGQYRKQHEKTG